MTRPVQAAGEQPRIEIPALTGLRGVAALWVVLLHTWSFAGSPKVELLGLPIWRFFACGWMGVDLFFVLSGFLLGTPFVLAARGVGTAPDLRRFWRKRIGRVIPAYWGQLLLLAGLALWIDGQWPMTWLETLAQFTLTENLLPVFKEPLNPVHWSLPVEWDFYILLPLLALPWRRLKPWQVFALAIAFGVLWRIACMYAFHLWQADGLRFYTTVLQLPSRVDEFFAGMLAGVAVAQARVGRPWLAILAGALLALGLAWPLGAVGDFVSGGKLPWLYVVYSVLAVAFGLLVAGAARGGRLARVLFANPPLRFAGVISYSLYLWHYPVLEWLRQAKWIGVDAGFGVSLAITLVVSVGIATLSWRLLERPFHTPPRKPEPAATPSPA